MVQRIGSRAFVGRDADIAALRDALGDAERRAPSLTLVSGEAGVGKTRLLRELEADARGAGAAVLWGECVPVGDGELPYAPIVAALRDLARGPAAEALDALPAQLRAGLGRLVPELGDREAHDDAVS